MIHSSGDISYLTFDSFDRFGLKHGIFMRHGGISPSPWKSLNMSTSVGDSRENVVENRRRLTSAIGVKEQDIYDVWQVHSSKVVYTNKPRLLNEKHVKADAIITDKSELAIMMLFADCVPILFVDAVRNTAGIAHAGWQGTVKNIVGKMVQALKHKFNSSPEDITAAIGPAICADHYEVGSDVVHQARNVFDKDSGVIMEKKGAIFFDLVKANHILLERSGVLQIETADICTACNLEDWFSHRGENGKTGRFGAIISLDRYE